MAQKVGEQLYGKAAPGSAGTATPPRSPSPAKGDGGSPRLRAEGAPAGAPRSPTPPRRVHFVEGEKGDGPPPWARRPGPRQQKGKGRGGYFPISKKGKGKGKQQKGGKNRKDKGPRA